jgi:asparagine synthase (glutamine-hydrolysing)
VPFLDPRVIEFSFGLPARLKVRESRTKWILREILDRHVPRALTDRPKMGFSIPLGAWLRGPLRDWAEDLLAERRLRDEGWIAPGPVRRRWDEHLSGRRDWQYHLWNVLMFQAWLRAS